MTSSDATERLRVYGSNQLAVRRDASLFRQIIDRVGNPLVLILLFAASISAWTGDTVSFSIIVFIITMSVLLDLAQHRRAENAIRALQQSVALTADVIRDGATSSLPVSELVPGDVVHLTAGDIVPADYRLISARDFFVNQAMMTGESFPVEKHALDPADRVSEPGESVNWLFMGTSVLSGSAIGLVCSTGKSAAISSLAHSISETRPRDAFDRGIHKFGNLMLRLTTFLVLFVVTANALFHRPLLESLLFALALAVGLTPELLPMVVAVTLATGAKRMAARHVIVKRLPAIHDLGAMDVLCTDKTGTLTEASISLVKCVDAADQPSDRLMELAAVNSAFETGIKSPLDEAILAKAQGAAQNWVKIDEVPFDFERRRVSVLAERNQDRLLIVKGAPEDIIALSSTTLCGSSGSDIKIDRDRIYEQFNNLGAEGYRALAVAFRQMPIACQSAVVADEQSLTFAGFLAFADPPKTTAAAALRQLDRSGVDVKILTGDNERITRHLCASIGIDISGVLTGSDIALLSDEALQARLRGTNLFCRITPQQKKRIISALKRAGNVVGFLGDGVNDAPALRAADVGLSVDSGTDVAKEAADIVLLDHDLGTVHAGVIEGRRTVENVTKYILMGASSNFGNMFSMAGAALFLPFLPMLPTQVLLNNLLYDVSEIGVPFDNVDEEILTKPAHWDIKLIERFMFFIGPISSVFDFVTFFILLRAFGATEAQFQTGWFIESLATQVFVIWVIRTRASPWRSQPCALLATLAIAVVAIGMILPVTPLAPVLGFVSLPATFYLFVFAALAVYLSAVEMAKRYVFASGTRVDRLIAA